MIDFSFKDGYNQFILITEREDEPWDFGQSVMQKPSYRHWR